MDPLRIGPEKNAPIERQAITAIRARTVEIFVHFRNHEQAKWIRIKSVI
jgi:hypothetical protein